MLLSLFFVSGLALAQGRSVTIDGETFRDPMQPPWAVTDIRITESAAASGPRLSELSLSFVRAGGLSPVAVINDTQVTVGDEIEGAPVVEIRPGEVVLLIDGEEQVLTRFLRPVRTPVEN
ncbi:hypothetical protein PHACT_06895 [Pseudohongiella acticola]|uniref:Uncharacterized protein n=2 Tax=Pseudohongiella acticola TaxID=1524254 RepID=A0A1E8CKS1_9GAMM|nr:hypothetical protein PHACT_06895 [Pseudohongiella acticola]